jgi:mannitol-1-phosphate 5-dehydrogenase
MGRENDGQSKCREPWGRLRLLELAYRPVHLATVIGAVLRYDYPEDEQAAELQETIRAEGERSALAQCAGIGEGHPLVVLVVERLDRT